MTPQPNGTYTGVIKGTVDGKPEKPKECTLHGEPAGDCELCKEIRRFILNKVDEAMRVK